MIISLVFDEVYEPCQLGVSLLSSTFVVSLVYRTVRMNLFRRAIRRHEPTTVTTLPVVFGRAHFLGCVFLYSVVQILLADLQAAHLGGPQ
jgi:hypothetical protein